MIIITHMLKEWITLVSPKYGNFKVPSILLYQKIWPPFQPDVLCVLPCQTRNTRTRMQIHTHRAHISWLSLISWHGHDLAFPDCLCRFYKSTIIIKSCWPLVEYPSHKILTDRVRITTQVILPRHFFEWQIVYDHYGPVSKNQWKLTHWKEDRNK